MRDILHLAAATYRVQHRLAPVMMGLNGTGPNPTPPEKLEMWEPHLNQDPPE